MALTQNQLIQLANNPQRGVDTVVTDVENNWFDQKVTWNSKSHPAVLAIDVILGSSFGYLNQMTDSLSKLFPAHARNISDLSRHMSDEEKVGIFANPSSCSVRFAINEDIFLAIAKDVTVTIGKATYTYKMILIPKDTEITVSGYTFALENGIEIRYGDKTGYQVVYDSETNSPFNPIANNLLTRGFKQSGSSYFLYVDIPCRQLLTKVTENVSSNVSSGCKGTITYTDDLYAVRAFLTVNSVKTEIQVTFDQDVFAPNAVTLTLDLDTTAKTISFQIPDVYIVNGLGIGIVDIYVLTTKGALVKNFTKAALGDVTPNYQDYRYGAGTLNNYAAVLRNTGGVAWQFIESTSGGLSAVPFDTIKANFLEGRRSRSLPITENDVSGTVGADGYTSVKAIDYVTKRTYAVTKELPIQDNKGFYSPMGVFVGSYLTSANDLVASGVVLDNGKRITIPHDVMFNITDDSTLLVNGLTKAQYTAMTGAQKVDLMGSTTLVYTPFYYVLDTTSNQAVLRTYHLDNPVVNQQTFVAENSTLGFELGVGALAIEHQDDGYLITVVTQSGSSYQALENEQIGVQLSIPVDGSTTPATMAGTLYGITEEGERIYQFKLDSRFDVDSNDVIYFSNFKQFGDIQSSIGSTLNLDMTFIFTYQGDKEYTATDSDALIDQTLFNVPMIAIIQTAYNVDLGKRLNYIYSRIRPLVGSAQYQRYAANVPSVYAADEYKRDPATGFLVYDADGKVIVLHRAGDIRYDAVGNVEYAYLKGDVVYDVNQKPVVLAPRDLEYHFDFIAFDANYYFSQDPYDIEFAQDSKDQFSNVITSNLTRYGKSSLDQTNLVYQPRSKLGYMKVIINSNYEATLKQDIGFVVTWYLSATGYRNTALKKALEASTPKVLNMVLYDAVTFSTSDIINALMVDVSAEVKAVKISAVSGNAIVDIISNADSLSGFSLRKYLEQDSGGLLTVAEDVDTVFQPHDTSMVTMITT